MVNWDETKVSKGIVEAETCIVECKWLESVR